MSKKSTKRSRQAEALKRGLAAARKKTPQVDKAAPLVPSTHGHAKLVSQTKVTLDHDLAYELLDLPGVKEERNVIDGWVQTLYDCMRQGRFLWERVDLVTCTFDNVKYRLNGQHTCWARLNMPANYGAPAMLHHYKAATFDELLAVYAAIDANKVRSAGHRTGILLTANEDAAGIPKSLRSLMSTGMVHWLYEQQKDQRKLQPEDKAELISDPKYSKTFRLVGDIVQENLSVSRFLKRKPVLAALFATFDKVPTIAPEFWQPVADGIGLDERTDARWQLRQYLQQHGLSANKDSGCRVVDTEVMYRVCIAAWNKWRAGVPVQLLKPSSTRVKLQ